MANNLLIASNADHQKRQTTADATLQLMRTGTVVIQALALVLMFALTACASKPRSFVLDADNTLVLSADSTGRLTSEAGRLFTVSHFNSAMSAGHQAPSAIHVKVNPGTTMGIALALCSQLKVLPAPITLVNKNPNSKVRTVVCG